MGRLLVSLLEEEVKGHKEGELVITQVMECVSRNADTQTSHMPSLCIYLLDFP